MSTKIQQKWQEIVKMSQTRKGLFGLLGILCLFVLFYNCYDTVQYIISKVIGAFARSDFMTALVVLVIIFGCSMAVRSMVRIHREMDLLDHHSINALDGRNINALYACKKELEEQHANSLLFQRLDVLMRGATEKGLRAEVKPPTMPDMREISMQSELSNEDSAGMSTIVSFLLILGILGTLTGVHGALHGDGYDLEIGDLASAMRPSACAVLGTLLLMAMRAWYMRKVDKYMGQLDSITMKRILPLLTREPEMPDGSELIENMEGLESVAMPEFQSDSTLAGEWNEISRAAERSREQVKQLLNCSIQAPQEAPAVPMLNPGQQPCFVVKIGLSDQRIQQGNAFMPKVKKR